MIFYKLFHATRMYEKQKLSKLFLSYCHISFLKAITKIYMYCSNHCGSLIKFIRNELFDASLILFNSLISGQSRFQKTLRFQSGQIDLQTTISHDTLSFIDLRKNASSNEQINAINFSPFPHYFSPPPLPIERAITPSQKSPSLPPFPPLRPLETTFARDFRVLTRVPRKNPLRDRAISPISAPLYSSRDFSILLAVNILLLPRHQIPIVSFPLGRSRFGNVVSRSLSSRASLLRRGPATSAAERFGLATSLLRREIRFPFPLIIGM